MYNMYNHIQIIYISANLCHISPHRMFPTTNPNPQPPAPLRLVELVSGTRC